MKDWTHKMWKLTYSTLWGGWDPSLHNLIPSLSEVKEKSETDVCDRSRGHTTIEKLMRDI